MSQLLCEEVLSVTHWNDKLFSFRTTRHSGFRFKNGHFTMIGLEVQGRPLLRAYSIASANYEDELEFFSIKVPDGPLSSRLQLIKPGDPVLVSNKPTGTLVLDNILPGRHLYLLSTGTGLAPFLSIIKDPETYEQYHRVVLIHGCRYVQELAYQQTINETLPGNPWFGEQVRNQLLYYPTITREAFKHQGRVTTLLSSGKLNRDIGLPLPDPEHDRFLICGSPAMLKESCALLEHHGFQESRHGKAAQYAIERAFVA